MNNYDLQKSVIKAIETVVDAKLGESSTTNSTMGVVVEDPKGFACKVDMNGQIFTCSLPEHLHTWIQKDDIVIIQDLYNNGVKRVVTGKTGSTRPSPSIVFHDEESGGLIGGVDYIEDENGNKMDSYGTI